MCIRWMILLGKGLKPGFAQKQSRVNIDLLALQCFVYLNYLEPEIDIQTKKEEYCNYEHV